MDGGEAGQNQTADHSGTRVAPVPPLHVTIRHGVYGSVFGPRAGLGRVPGLSTAARAASGSFAARCRLHQRGASGASPAIGYRIFRPPLSPRARLENGPATTRRTSRRRRGRHELGEGGPRLVRSSVPEGLEGRFCHRRVVEVAEGIRIFARRRRRRPRRRRLRR